jgi:hypothetical protein
LPLPRFRRSRSPLWFEDGSDFQKEIADQLGGKVAFVGFLWSGRNSIRARLRAARGLAERISQTATSEPGARQVVIAHSHGGNVAAHAVALLDPSSRPAGVATLATPFLHVRGRALDMGERVTVWAAMAMPILFVIFSADHLPYWLYWTRNSIELIPQVAYVFAFTLMAVAWTAHALWGRWRDTPRRRQSPDLPDDLNLLILRAPGDEASLALASAGFFTLVSRFLWALLAFPAWVVVWVCKFFAASGLRWIDYIALMFQYLISLPLIIFGILIIMIAYGILALFTVPWLWAMSSVLLMPFGFEFVALGPTAEVTAESAPEGRWSIEILPPADTAAAGLIGRHGIHAHPVARARVAAWLDSILALHAAQA